MKPIGPITNYFPHVDDETKSIVQSIMEVAENYADFVERLCDKVRAETTSPLLQYIAFSGAFHLTDFNLLDKMEAADKVPDMAVPLLLVSKSYRNHPVSWDEMVRSVRKALEAAPNDWLASHLYLLWRLEVEDRFPEADVDVQPIETIQSTVDANRELEFFNSALIVIRAMRYFRENELKKGIELLQKALAIVRKYDEQLVAANLLFVLGNQIKHDNLQHGIDLVISSRELSESLGYKYRLGMIDHAMGHIMALRGELDAAVKYQFESIASGKSLGLTTSFLHSVIAFYFNKMGKGSEALENARIGASMIGPASRHLAYTRAQLAWALINIGRLEEAKDVLRESKELALTSGDSRQLSYVQTVEGILDKAESNFDSALANFQEVLNFYEKNQIPMWETTCYLKLTEIEIDMLNKVSLKENLESSGPWMEKLEEYTQKNDLPGYAAQALLLKAKLRHKQGQFDEVRRILKDVQKIGEAPSMRYLNDLAISMFPDIIVT